MLKYKDKYICVLEDNEYEFLQLPNYFYAEDIAMGKTLEDEVKILEYYDNVLKPKILKKVRLR